MGKKRPKMPREAVIGPTPERWARREVELVQPKPGESAPLVDVKGLPSQPFRIVTTLMAMERKGTISAEMRKAGEKFRDDFAIAGLDQLRAADLLREAGQGRGGEMSTRIIGARRDVWEAVQALGGPGSPAGCCAWYVLGIELSIADWARREGWRGRPIAEKPAAGILIGALGTLQAHYGY